MTSIAITSTDPQNARKYIQVIESLGAEIRLLTPPEDRPTEVLMDGIGGLLLPGGPDVDPQLYGESPDPVAQPNASRPLDDLDLRLLHYSLARDLPVLAICGECSYST